MEMPVRRGWELAPPDSGPDYRVSDITAVYCLRAHADNPWVIDRLRLAAEHYSPQPHVLVCDFGSKPPFCDDISTLCQQFGFEYFRVEDDGVYSAAVAHNRAFEQVKTELLFFSDIDTFGRSTLFEDLADLASDLGLKQRVDTALIMPVVHLSEPDTARILRATSPRERSALMRGITLTYLYREASQAENALTVPYSNIYLMRRDLFDLVGGYDERFRGHGSEDFEFLTRLAIYCKHLPLPRDWRRDCYGPLKKEFYDSNKGYVGFRRLIEAMAFPADVLGQRVFHLWHPRDQAGWSVENDWKRERLRSAFDSYAVNDSALLGIDFIQRPKRAVCICKHTDHWGYFLPLRIAGYKLLPISDETPESIREATRLIAEGEVHAMAIFNPYMKSHALFKSLFLFAKERIGTLVVERGALPATVYYASDVSYATPEFSEEAFQAARFDDAEMQSAERYIASLRTGNRTLEQQEPYERTSARYASLRLLERPICFIPTQLEDDMAVTHFVTGGQNYAEFVTGIGEVIDQNPDVLFVVKPHPLSKLTSLSPRANLIVAERADNVHFLIDCAKWVVCYNSGVGLIALLHGKPVITIGNAFYNYSGAGHRAASLAEAVAIGDKADPPSPDMILRLAAWFTQRKYSTFFATDHIRDFETRKAHAYKDILVTHFRWGDHNIPLGRQRQDMPFSARSYLVGRIGVANKAGAKKPTQPPPKRAARGHKWRKLRRDPHAFFRDAHFAPLRSLRFMFRATR